MRTPTSLPLTLDEFEQALQRRRRRPATVAAYRRYLATALEANDLVAPVRAATSRSAYWVARAAVQAYAREAGLGDVEALLDAVPEPRRPARESVPVPEDDWRAILRVARDLREPDRSAMELLLLSGLRIGDFMGITRGAAQEVLARGEVVITQKGGATRTWAPSSAVRDSMGRLLQNLRWQRVQDLFAKNASTAQNRCRRFLAYLCERARVEYANPHRFRHGVATLLDESGKRLTVIQRALGHASARTTERYVHVAAREQSAAMDVVAERLLRP